MALFDQQAPTENYFTPMKLATGSTRLKLALAGYKADGSQNSWGSVSSWLPGWGVALNKAAGATAKNNALPGVAENIQDDSDNRVSKLMTQLGVIQGVIGGFTGNPQLIQSGASQAIKGAVSLSKDGTGVNREDDGSVSSY